MVASEPLTFEKADWMEIPTNTMFVITPKMNALQIPIEDEYHVPPSDPASRARSGTFASEKGFLAPRPDPVKTELNGSAKPILSPILEPAKTELNRSANAVPSAIPV